MGAFLNLLTSEAFRRRTGMYVGSDRFRDVRHWLEGFEHALLDAVPDECITPSIPGGPHDPGLDGIHEWLIVKLSGRPNIGWLGIIQQAHGEGAEATQKLFELIDEFLADVKTRGLKAIIDEHLQYELRIYDGSAFNSRLANKDNPRYGYIDWDNPISPVTAKPYAEEGKRHLAWAEYYDALAAKHRHAANYPTLPMWPDPPAPE